MRIPFISHLAIALVVLLLTGCAMDVRVALDSVKQRFGISRITSDQEFRDTVVGRVFSNDRGSATYHADETMSGELDGQALTGYWFWDDDLLCRTIRLGDEFLGSDCQALFVSGDRMTVVGNEGTGEKETYRLPPPGS